MSETFYLHTSMARVCYNDIIIPSRLGGKILGFMNQTPRTSIWRRLLRLFYILILLAPFLVIGSYAMKTPRADFYYFYYALQLVWRHLPADTVYNLSAQQGWFVQHGFRVYTFNEYVYPPQFAVLFSWLAAFRLNIASDVWSWISITGYLGGIWMISSLAQPTRHLIPRIIFYTTALVNFPFWWDLAIGNANSVIFVLVSAGIYLRYVRRLPWLAGVPLGLAAVLKVTPVVLLVYFFLQREWKIFFTALSTIILSTTLSLITLGPGPLTYYVLHLSSFARTSMENGNAPYNSSLIGVLGYWKEHNLISWSPVMIHTIYLAYVVLLALLVGLAVLRSRKKRNCDIRSSLALGVLTILLFSPLIEGAHLMLVWISASLLFGTWWANNLTGKATDKGTQGSAWRKAGIVALFGIVWIILSPLGWFLQSVFAWEYFFVLCVLVSMSLLMQCAETQDDPISSEKVSLTQ